MDGCSPIARLGVQRTALHYEIAVASVPAHAPVQSLASIVKAFAESSAKGDAVWSRGGAVFQIARVRFNKTSTRAILLLHCTVGAAAASAHLVIDLAPSPEKSGVYQAILEDAGLTKSSIEQGLQGIARKFSEFYFKEASGRFRPGHPRLSFTACEEASVFAAERELVACEAEIRPDVSLQLDTLLKQRAASRS